MYYFLQAVGWLLAKLPDAGLSKIAAFLSWLAFDVVRLRRKLVLQNLWIAFGNSISENRRYEIARESIKNFVLTILEFLRSTRIDIASDVQIVGIENVLKALDQGKGVYIICCHMGNWEAFGAAVTRQIAPARVVVKKVGSDSVNRFVDELRNKNGLLTVFRRKKGDGYRAILEALKRNEIVGFAMDQARPGEPKLDFFGVPAKTNTSLAAIWRKHPAPLIPAFLTRSKVGSHTAHFLPPLELQLTADPKADMLHHTQYFNHVIERIVRSYPEHYLWLHDRWKE